MQKYIKAKDVLYLLNVSRTTLDTWIKQGKFPPPIKVARVLLWKEEEIENWLEGKRKPAVA